MVKKWLSLVIGLFLLVRGYGQEPFPFYNDVQKFKTADSVSFPASGQILLIGSSSFTRWTDVAAYFPGHNILNRAFGGSTIKDLIRYRYEIIFPYAPQQIIMYCGENDFASKEKPAVAEVVERFHTLYRLIRAKYPAISFVYVSMKPSPSRKHLMPEYQQANALIKAALQKDKNAKYVDVYSAMLRKDGSLMEDIFVQDNLHMNDKGYAIWKQALLPYLGK